MCDVNVPCSRNVTNKRRSFARHISAQDRRGITKAYGPPCSLGFRCISLMRPLVASPCFESFNSGNFGSTQPRTIGRYVNYAAKRFRMSMRENADC